MNSMVLGIGGGSVLIVAMALAAMLYLRKSKQGGGAVSQSKLAVNLRDEKAKSDIILRAIDDGVVLIDDQNVIRHFNQGAADITGWKREEAEGLDWRSVFRFTNDKGETINDDLTPMGKAASSGKPVRDNSLNIVGKSNKPIVVSFSVSPLSDEGARSGGLVGIFRDISEERKEENQRAEFISTASHEMRTPVAAIEGYLSLALNDKVATIDSRARGYLEKAHESTKHLGQLFQDLLTSAKAEDGRLTSHPRIVELGDFVEKLAGDLRFAAETKQLFMEFVFGNSTITDTSRPEGVGGKVVRPLYYVKADPDRLREVITNLFDNACKYTSEGKVTLGITANNTVVQLYVRDTGAGIPAEDIPHLFQKFYRVDNSATRTIGGTGLGLFISRKIVELYQGRIWVESELGKGSTFYINLPRIETSKAEAEAALEASTTQTLDI